MNPAMEMDIDWCLTCNKRTSRGKSYCSRQCRNRDELDVDCDPSTSAASSSARDDCSIHEGTPRRHASSLSRPSHKHNSRAPKPAPPQQQRYYDEEAARIAQWPGYNEAGIRAWASAIPPGCGSRKPEALSYCADVPRVRPEFPLSRQRPALPALCRNTTEPARTTYTLSPAASPIAAPLSPRADAHAQPHASCSVSSLVTALTESIATPESADAHVHASPARVTRPKPGVLENLASRFRTRTGAPPVAPIPTLEIMKTTTTTTTSTNVPNSPVESKMAQKTGAARNSAAGFTVLSTTHLGDEDDDVFSYPYGQAAFPDAEIKESLSAGKRGVWIAGRDGRTGCGYGPAYYEKGYLRSRSSYRAPLDLPLGSDRDREIESAAFKARGRKPSRT